MKKNRVIIIGAGPAGLSAAKTLAEHSQFTCVHLEAQARVGGRVQTFSCENGFSVDSGGSFIHTKNLTLYQAAKQRNLLAGTGRSAMLLSGRYIPAAYFHLRHVPLNLLKLNKLWSNFYGINDPHKSLGQLIATLDFSSVLENFLRSSLGSALGCSVDQVGLLAIQKSMKKSGFRPEREMIQQALKKPLATLLQDIYSKQIVDVITNSPVLNINFETDAVLVKCRDGQEYEAKKIILTVPLSILQQGKIQFVPSLPSAHQHAIASLGMGQGLKFLLQFRRIFWRKGLRQIINVDGLFHFWVPDVSQPVLSVFYVATDNETLDEEILLDKIMTTLSIAFSQNVAALLVDSQQENWSKNPYICGLYSYDAIGSEGARSQLQEPIDNRIYLAGEATVEGHFSTVDGAIESGKRAAQQVMGI